MTPKQIQEITDKLDEALALLQEVKILLGGGYAVTAGEWRMGGATPPYLFEGTDSERQPGFTSPYEFEDTGAAGREVA